MDAQKEEQPAPSVGSKRPASEEPGAPSSQAKRPHAHSPVTVAVSEDKGCKSFMEDVHCVEQDKGVTLFAAVIDGHAGKEVASAVAGRLHSHFMACGLQQVYAESVGASPSPKKVNGKAAKTAVIEAFKRTDEEVLALANKHGWVDGACAVAFWLLGNTGIIANCGDSKGVLARVADKDGPGGIKAGDTRALMLTKEHLAIYPAERSRIEKAGGSISEGRLQGKMQVARSFGDAAMKKYGCTSQPDVTAFELGPRDQFLLLASDGFWSVFDAQHAVNMAQSLLKEGWDPRSVTNKLLNEAVRERKCKDNVTLVLVLFSSIEAGKK